MSITREQAITSYLQKVCLSTAGGLILTGAAAAATITYAPAGLISDKALLLGGAIAGIGSMIGICFSRTEYEVKDGEVTPKYSIAQKILYPVFFLSEGISLAPMLGYATYMVPNAIPISLAITGATVAGMVTYALCRPKGSLLKWGAPLQIGMWGLLGTGVVAAITRSSAAEMAGCVAGVGLFAATTAYDVHKAVEQYEAGRPDYMMQAATFYLDFMNMFIRTLEIYIKLEAAKKKKQRVFTY